MKCTATKKTQDHTDQIKNKLQDLLVNTSSATRRVTRRFKRGVTTTEFQH